LSFQLSDYTTGRRWPVGSGVMRRPLVPLPNRPNPTHPGDAADLSIRRVIKIVDGKLMDVYPRHIRQGYDPSPRKW
jgi:hypothetical protein